MQPRARKARAPVLIIAGSSSAIGAVLGARAFRARGCIACHGAPGVVWEKFAEAMRPDPPDLKDIAKEQSAGEIFWVVKNGINMTAMPSFARINVDDNEIWAIAAFVKKLPTVSPDDFKAWTAP